MNKVSTYVYKNVLGDCTNRGLTSKHERLDLYYGQLDNEAIDKLTEDSLILIERVLWGKKYLHAVPVEIYKRGQHSMAGGNFIYTSDSRFPSDSPISVHDRVEINN